MLIQIILALIAGAAAGTTYFLVGQWWLARHQRSSLPRPTQSSKAPQLARGPTVDRFIQAFKQERGDKS
jgi:hypothetical protein